MNWDDLRPSWGLVRLGGTGFSWGSAECCSPARFGAVVVEGVWTTSAERKLLVVAGRRHGDGWSS